MPIKLPHYIVELSPVYKSYLNQIVIVFGLKQDWKRFEKLNFLPRLFDKQDFTVLLIFHLNNESRTKF